MSRDHVFFVSTGRLMVEAWARFFPGFAVVSNQDWSMHWRDPENWTPVAVVMKARYEQLLKAEQELTAIAQILMSCPSLQLAMSNSVIQPRRPSRFNAAGHCCFCNAPLKFYDTKMVHQNKHEEIACTEHFSSGAYGGEFTNDDPKGFLCWTDG